MTVQSLIDLLEKIDDKSLDVAIETENENLWVHGVVEHPTGHSGHELNGVVELKVSE